MTIITDLFRRLWIELYTSKDPCKAPPVREEDGEEGGHQVVMPMLTIATRHQYHPSEA